VSEVRLRAWRPGDAAAITAALEDVNVLKWSDIAELGSERWVARERQELRGPSRAICTAGDDRVVGRVALRLPGRASPAVTCDAMRRDDQPAGEMSYWVLPHARGRGVATAAVTAMLDIARGIGGMRSVVLDIEPDNVASIRVAERAGARRREPPRVQHDRNGVARTLVVLVARL
jgi:[ribosomal protein S5]-alanine N-acetyltransferase